jgi:hypothetical protein
LRSFFDVWDGARAFTVKSSVTLQAKERWLSYDTVSVPVVVVVIVSAEVMMAAKSGPMVYGISQAIVSFRRKGSCIERLSQKRVSKGGARASWAQSNGLLQNAGFGCP